MAHWAGLVEATRKSMATKEENIISGEDKKAFVKLEQFNNFNILVNTVAYVQRALSKFKPATLVDKVEERKGESNHIQITRAKAVC